MKYEYVTVKIGKFIGARCTEHREIIDDYAIKGYKYVGFIPTEISDYGKFKEIDMIFEMQDQLV